MELSDVTADLSYDELVKIVDENAEPFYSLSQCDLYLRAASIFRRRVPEEQDHGGERMVTHDIETMMAQARKARGRFLLTAKRFSVVVPTDDLR